MNDSFGKRLIVNERGEATQNTPTAILGSASTLSRSLMSRRKPLRISVYPIISHDIPKTGQGLTALLCSLLEIMMERTATVYRILAQLPDEVEDGHSWQSTASDVTPEAWFIDDLDDNVTLNGRLENKNDRYHLELELESDLISSDDIIVLSYDYDTLAQLISQLPTVVVALVRMLDDTVLIDQQLIHGELSTETIEQESIESLLYDLFQWDLHLYMSIWKQKGSDDQVKRFEKLWQEALALENELLQAATIASIANVFKYTSARVYSKIVEDIIAKVPSSTLSAAGSIILANRLFHAERPDVSQQMLEQCLAQNPANSRLILALSLQLRQSGKISEAVDVLQDSIHNERADARIYSEYASLLTAIDYLYGADTVEKLVLIDEPADDETLMDEVIEALYEVLDLDQQHPTAAPRLLAALVEGRDVEEDEEEAEEIWEVFETLLQNDADLEQLQAGIDAVKDAIDVEPGIQLVQQYIGKTPERSRLHIALASLYLAHEDPSSATAALDKAEALVDENEKDLEAQIDNLRLEITHPDLEMKLADIETLLNSRKKLVAKDVEFLESIVEQSPTRSDVALLLARGYMGWQEPDVALETILDSLTYTKHEPALTELAVRIIWEKGDQQLAFDYLYGGLDHNPSYVPLLAIAGDILFETGNREEARYYLSRAESINPQDPRFRYVQQKIATRGNAT